jgi:hypothetical protein
MSMNADELSSRKPDRLTLASIAVLAYVISTVAHEAVGHGGACLVVGCTPRVLTSMSFDGDYTHFPRLAERIIAAGGYVVNLIVAALAFLMLRRIRPGNPASWVFCWLLGTVSLLQATGYLLFSGLGGIGDWVVVVADLPGGALWHIGLAIVGGVTYWLAVRQSMLLLGPRLHTAMRSREAYGYTLIAYFAGGTVAIVAGMFDPSAAALLLISAAAASLGGTSGLLWGPQLLRNPPVCSGVRTAEPARS